MKLTVETIKAMNPCVDRFNNFLKHYPGFVGTVEDFVLLENISYSDKIWVLTRVMNHKQKVAFAIKCGLSALSIYEQKYPSDARPKKALEAAETWLANPTTENVAYAAAAAAAAYAAAAAAYADAAAVAAAAANVAVAAAAAAATYAAAAAAYAAAYAADAAAYADAGSEQEELNLIFAVEVLSA